MQMSIELMQSRLPIPPPLTIIPPLITNDSYQLYYQKKHLMLINGEQQYNSGKQQVDHKLKSKYQQNESNSIQHQLNGQQRRINITLIGQCNRCQNWLLKSEMNIHMTFHAAVIKEYLFLGDKFSSQSRKEIFQRCAITHIVNAASQLKNHFQKEIQYLQLQLLDIMTEDVIQPSLIAAQFIKTAVQNGGKVFVHCAMGKSRSVCVILVYLIKYQGFSLEESLNLVKKKRSIVRPNTSYLLQLQKFYTDLKLERKQQQTKKLKDIPQKSDK